MISENINNSAAHMNTDLTDKHTVANSGRGTPAMATA